MRGVTKLKRTVVQQVLERTVVQQVLERTVFLRMVATVSSP